MDEENIRSILHLGAWPSLAATIEKAAQGLANYGEYSAVFPRSVIDMEANGLKADETTRKVDFDEALVVAAPDSAPIELLAAMRRCRDECSGVQGRKRAEQTGHP